MGDRLSSRPAVGCVWDVSNLNILKKDKSYHCRKINKKKIQKWFIVIVNLTKWVLQKYPLNPSGDMLTLSWRNLFFKRF